MKSFSGKGVSGGAVLSALRFYRPQDSVKAPHGAADPREELRRLETACAAVGKKLEALAQKAREEGLGEEVALLFETHALMLRDEELREDMERGILGENRSAEEVILSATKRQAELFGQLEDEYMKERAQDVHELQNHLLSALSDGENGFGVFDEGECILAAHEFIAADILNADKKCVKGLISAAGSVNSHVAVLARLKGIPMVMGAGEALFALRDGCEIFMDGETGEITAELSETARNACLEKIKARERYAENLMAYKNLPAETRDGHRIGILANVSGPEELAAAAQSGAEGIGLYRTEFLYLREEKSPDEETQFACYRAAAELFGGKRVVIRTADLGGDKSAAHLGLPEEENPALGMRGIRVSFARPDLFRTQLRALCRASAYGKIAVMFPMIASLWELEKAKECCRAVQDELRREGFPFDEDMPLGMMVETPAAVMLADLFAASADFFSIGTNDLTQYMLGLDRCADPGEHYDAWHPAVLRAVKAVAETARRAEIPVCVCGDLAADTALCGTFLSVGVDLLSMAPSEIVKVKKAIHELERVEKDPLFS